MKNFDRILTVFIFIIIYFCLPQPYQHGKSIIYQAEESSIVIKNGLKSDLKTFETEEFIFDKSVLKYNPTSGTLVLYLKNFLNKDYIFENESQKLIDYFVKESLSDSEIINKLISTCLIYLTPLLENPKFWNFVNILSKLYYPEILINEFVEIKFSIALPVQDYVSVDFEEIFQFVVLRRNKKPFDIKTKYCESTGRLERLNRFYFGRNPQLDSNKGIITNCNNWRNFNIKNEYF